MEPCKMPKKRSAQNRGYPARWVKKHGALYYRVPPGMEPMWDGKKWFKLGKTDHEAYVEWSKRIPDIKRRDICGLIDRYMNEVAPAKAPKTFKGNQAQAKKIRAVFGKLYPEDIKPKHIYRYVDERGAFVAAKREIALFSHVLTKAVEWGYIDKHPFKGEVRLEGEKPRTRYVEDWEIIECLNLSSKRKKGSVHAIKGYIRLKLLTGLRRGDLLRLRVADYRENGLSVQTAKTGKAVIYERTAELDQAITMAKKARPIDISPYLFCNKFGQPYIDDDGDVSGWDSMWQRFMTRVLGETKITERFTEHDLRAKCASDAKTLEHARQLLTHADSKITDKVYRRKPEVVRPLK